MVGGRDPCELQMCWRAVLGLHLKTGCARGAAVRMEGGMRGRNDWFGLLRGDPIESGFVAASGLDVRSPTAAVQAVGPWHLDSVTSSLECDVCIGNLTTKLQSTPKHASSPECRGFRTGKQCPDAAVTTSPCPSDFHFEVLVACGIGQFLSSVR